jgi:hypothetical protein
MNSISNWETVSNKLQHETKEALIQLIQELTAVSPEAQRYLQTRYSKGETTTQIAPIARSSKNSLSSLTGTTPSPGVLLAYRKRLRIMPEAVRVMRLA